MRWLLLPFLAAVAPAQTVWTVPGMFRQIHQALAVAQPGDVIEVANGNYQPFAVTQGVTIRGTGTAVSVALGSPVTFDVPAGQQAYAFQIQLYSGAQVLRGSAAFERCRFDGPTAALEVDTAGQAVLVQSFATASLGRQHGALVRGHLAAVNSTFDGSLSWVAQGGHGLVVDGGSVQLAQCRLRGGGAVLPAHPASDGLLVLAGHAWLSDCDVQGGTSQVSASGVGVHNQTTTPVLATRTNVSGGSGTPPGSAVLGPYSGTAPLLGIWPLGNGLARGTNAALGPRGPVGMPVFAYFGLRAEVVSHPALAAPAWLDSTLHLLDAGVLDATGNALFPIAIPNLPWVRDVRLFFQVYGVDVQGQVQATPPIASLVQ